MIRSGGRLLVGAAFVWALAGAAAVVAGCSGPAGVAGDRPAVVATTGIWADVMSRLACGGQADVEALLPPGVDPHDAELSMAARARLSTADLVVANGLGLEGALDNALGTVRHEGVPVVEVGSTVPTRRTSSGAVDPHLWTDPQVVAAAVPGLADALVRHAGLSRTEVDRCADRLLFELKALDHEMADTLGRVPPDRRLLVTSHDSLGYLADRYGYEVVGTVIPSPSSLAETNPADMQRLADTVRRSHVPAVFAEVGLSRVDAEAVARETGAKVVTLSTDVLGPPGSDTADYQELMRTMARRIAHGLGAGDSGNRGG